jgi:mono/diheme cytochrome c family protein
VTPSRIVALAMLAAFAAGCGQEKLGPEAERGRQVYQAQCIACHHPDPAQPGPIGPPVRGASEDLLRAKIATGSYPPGYTPKRPTKVMQPMPQAVAEVPALAAYLR